MPIRVLLLEPDEELLESFEAYLSRFSDFDVRYTSDGEECVSLMQSFRPDVLVLEPALPRGVAESILEQVGQFNQGPAVPVLVLTNRRNWIDENHPSIHEFHIKPQSLRFIADRIRQLTAG